MKVLVDGHMIGSGEGGNERYITSLVEALSKIVKVDVLVGNNVKKLKGRAGLVRVRRSNLARYLFEMPRLLMQGKYDLLFTTYFVSPLVAKRNVVMVHDLLPMRHPEFFNLRERVQFGMLRLSLYMAAGVIVPSQFVAEEIKFFMPNMIKKIFVIPEAANSVFRPKSRTERVRLRKQYAIVDFAVLVMASKYQKRPLYPVLGGLALLGFQSRGICPWGLGQ